MKDPFEARLNEFNGIPERNYVFAKVVPTAAAVAAEPNYAKLMIRECRKYVKEMRKKKRKRNRRGG